MTCNIIPATLCLLLLTCGCGRDAEDSSETATQSADAGARVSTIPSVAVFEQTLSDNHIVMVDFYADWCGPCKVLKPIISDVAADFEGEVKVVAVDIDALGALAQQFNIQSIPTVNVFRLGKLEASIVGVRTKSDYVDVIKSLLKMDATQP